MSRPAALLERRPSLPRLRKPLCFTRDELVGWWRANCLLKPGGGQAKYPCQDCTRGFYREQRDIGRCDGWPGFDGTGKED